MKTRDDKMKNDLNFTIEELENRLETVQITINGADPNCVSCCAGCSCIPRYTNCTCDSTPPPPNCPMGFEISSVNGDTMPMGATY